MAAKKRSKPMDQYDLPARLQVKMIPSRLRLAPKTSDVPEHTFFRLLVDRWREATRFAESCTAEERLKGRSMLLDCEEAASSILEWVEINQDMLEESDGALMAYNFGIFEGRWAGEEDQRHVWLEALVREPGTDDYYRWIIDPTANQFASGPNGTNDHRLLVVMPSTSQRAKAFYRHRESL